MRKAASATQQAARAQLATGDTVPAPVGGWNARDPLANMPPTDALVLDNWFPRESDCVIRGGASDHVTGFAVTPKTLATYNPPTASNKMFASTDAAVYDVTSAGALGASVASCTVGYWNWVQMGVSGGHYLMMFNGTDKPLYFDGTTWTSVDGVSTPAITGVTTTSLISANVFKRRLFLIEKNKLSFWYLPVDQVGGAASEFTLGPLCRKGGYLMAMGTWTIDSGFGLDDLAVFITSEGEAIVFAGTNPGSSVDWQHVGTYTVAKPLGRKCLKSYAGDLLLITVYGVLPLSKALTPAQSAAVQDRFTLTNKIDNAFTEAANAYNALEGWEALEFPNQNALLFNIPTSLTASQQFVMNTITKSWCRFTAWNAHAFALHNNELYFAENTKIAKAWTGASDFTANIVADAQTAYNYFKLRRQLKNWTLYRPNFLVNGVINFSIGLSIDFEQTAPLSIITYPAPSVSLWDSAIWDSSLWGYGLQTQQGWQTPKARLGYSASLLLTLATNAITVQWVATDFVWTKGALL